MWSSWRMSLRLIKFIKTIYFLEILLVFIFWNKLVHISFLNRARPCCFPFSFVFSLTKISAISEVGRIILPTVVEEVNIPKVGRWTVVPWPRSAHFEFRNVRSVWSAEAPHLAIFVLWNNLAADTVDPSRFLVLSWAWSPNTHLS